MKKLFTFESIYEMKIHAEINHLTLVAYKSVVYDLSEFLYEDHPTDPNVILQFANQSIDDVLFNQAYYKHNPKVISQLEAFKYGLIQKSSKPLSIKLIKSEKRITNQQSVIRARKFLNLEAEEKSSSLAYFSYKSHPWSQGQVQISITCLDETYDDYEEPIIQKIPVSSVRKFLK